MTTGSPRMTRTRKRNQLEEGRQVPHFNIDENIDNVNEVDDLCRHSVSSSHSNMLAFSCKDSINVSCNSHKYDDASKTEMKTAADKLGSLTLDNRMKEEDSDLRKRIEGELMALEAKALKEKAELMERHSMLLLGSNNSGEEQRQQASQEEIVNKDRMQRYLDDCNIRENAEKPQEGLRLHPEDRYYKNDIPRQNPIDRNDLPKLELPKYDGNSSDYWSFIKQFEIHIESRTSDARQRMLYLLNHCTGEARSAIKECALLPAEAGYAKAKASLKRLFGKSHIISRNLIDEVLRLPSIRKYDDVALTRLLIRMSECHTTLKQMDYLADLDAITTLQRIVDKFPEDVRDRWIRETRIIYEMGRNPCFEDLMQFVDEEASLAQSCFAERKSTAESNRSNLMGNAYKPENRWKLSSNIRDNRRQFDRNRIVNHVDSMPETKTVQRSCLECKEAHETEQCKQYLDRPIAQRWNVVKNGGGCFCCLDTRHTVRSCSYKKPCGIGGCKRIHHPSLHERTVEDKQERDILNSVREVETCVSLGVVPVLLSGPKGKITAYALIDSGANTTLIKRDVIEKVGITGLPTEITVNTIAGEASMEARKCDVRVLAMDLSDSVNMKGVFAVKDVPVRMRTKSMSRCIRNWPHLADIPLNVPDGKQVEMIVGCDQPKAHWAQEMRLGNESQPFGMKTPLGWIILGPVQQEALRSVNYIETQEDSEGDSWERMFQQLYNKEFEDVGSDTKCLSREEREALNIVEKGTVKVNDQYVVPLPWKVYPPRLPNNRQYAMKRLLNLRKRFQLCPELRERYNGIINDHIKKGYVTKLTTQEVETGNDSWYLPHHPVFNPRKPDKLRIVFDCAARYQNNSINDSLHQGPDTIANLVGVLLRFRRLPIAIIADIDEMFLQVKLTEDDQVWMRFLWWKDGKVDCEVETLKMLVHPFGARSSPFCANFALRRTIEDHKEGVSEQMLAIANRNFYVDDCIASVENVEVAKSIIKDLTFIMKKGGFKLRKWISNKKEALVNVPAEDLAKNVQLQLNKELPVERALGVEWDAEYDQFRFTFNDNNKPNTRRGVLSTIATVFDPLGLISPIILIAKVLLQSMCKLKLNWDHPLEGKNLEKWIEWKAEMNHLNQLTFPRCIRDPEFSGGVPQLHVFADASEVGYGAVAYVRMKIMDKYQCRLLMSKARVAPLKAVTIPRLELNAAVLALRLSKVITNEFNEQFESVQYWVDSTIVLRYLQNTSSRFVTFVANRVQEILESSRVNQWRHVPSEYNPADYASRGLSVYDPKLKLWMEGPEFLSKIESDWPSNDLRSTDSDILETKKIVLHMEREAVTAMDRLLDHYSNWFKLTKAVAWLIRFGSYYKTMVGGEGVVRVGLLNTREIEVAEERILRYVQTRSFPEEYTALRGNANTDCKFNWNTSKLKRLCPELRNGLIVVGGRLQLASLKESQRHPIIIPRDHAITRMIINYYHQSEGHAGVSQTLVALRERYWVLHGGATVKKVLRRCLVCRRLNATSSGQQMAVLPEGRVKEGWYPFQYVGVDYFGPFQVKRGRLLEKRYGCIFTCLQCRAIHLELAQSLSTDSFILALMRFMNRRGSPMELHSDNGSNFTGSEKELSDWLRRLDQVKITNRMIERKITWKFNPPHASHRGGIWERLIRSVRKILNSVAGRQSMDEETLWTYLTQAERIINDRPLTAVREGPGEPTPIRASDLLQPKARSFIAINLPLSQLVDRRWRIVNSLAAEFWKKWKMEYLTTLHERQKWIRRRKELQAGDIVITEVESTPRTYWPLGIIEEVIRDGDGLTRTVLVKTSNGVCKRDIRKVYLLEGVG